MRNHPGSHKLRLCLIPPFVARTIQGNQRISIFAEPAKSCAKEGALVGISQEVSDLGRAQLGIGKMMLYELASRFVDKLGERSAFAREFGRLVYPMRGEVTNPPSRHGSGGSFSTVANSHPLLKRIRTTPLTND